jgi:hypothetical protein
LVVNLKDSDLARSFEEWNIPFEIKQPLKKVRGPKPRGPKPIKPLGNQIQIVKPEPVYKKENEGNETDALQERNYETQGNTSKTIQYI